MVKSFAVARRSVFGRVIVLAMLLLPLDGFCAATVNLAYTPATINPGDPDTLTVSIFNDDTVNSLTNAAVTLSLPSGVSIAAAPAVVDGCGFSTVSVPANGSQVQLAGGVVPKATTVTGSCTLQFAVNSVATGNHPTTIPAGPVNGFTPGGTVVGFSAVDNGTTITNATPATATLSVNTLSNLTGSSSFNPVSAYASEVSRLSVLLTNPNASIDVPLTTFTDTLPVGMVIALAPGATVTCTGTGTAGTLSSASGSGTTVVAGDTSVTLTGGSIAGGKSCTLAFNVTAPSSTGAAASKAYNDSPGAIGNTRGLSGTPTAGTLTAQSPVTISQSVSPGTTYTSEPSTFTITITNASTVNTLSIGSFTDLFTGPGTITLGTPGVVCTGGTPGSVSTTGTTLTLTGAVAAAGGKCTITVSASMTGTGTLTSTSSGTSPATAMTTPGAGTVFVPTSTGSVTVNSPVSVSRAYAGGTLYAGDSTTLTITINNASTANALSIDSYTETLTGSGTGVAKIIGTPSVVCTGGTIGTLNVSGGVITLTGATAKTAGSCVITVTVSMSTDGTLSSTTSASPGTAFSNAVATPLSFTNNTNPRTKTVTAPVGVAQSFSSSTGQVRVGQPSVLTLVITNASSTNTETISSFTNKVTGVDTNNAAVSTSQITVTNLSVVCTGTGAVNGTATVDANDVVTVSGAVIGTNGNCTVTGNVSMGVAGTLKANSTANNGTPAAQISNTAIAPANFTVGASSSSVQVSSDFTVSESLSATTGYLGLPLTYTVKINNWSGGAASNVNFTDTLPNPTGGVLMVVSSSGSALGPGCSGGTFTATPGASSVSWVGGTVVAGNGINPGVCTITIVTSMPASSATGITYTNTLPANTSVTGQDSGGVAITNSNAASVSITSAAAVTISQAFNPNIKQFGSSVLTFTINNPTATPLTSLSFSEALNTALTIAPSSGLASTCSGAPAYTAVSGTSAFAVSGLSVGAGVTCTVKVNITGATVGTFSNTIPVGSISTFEGQTNSVSATASLTVTTALTATAAFSPASTSLNGSSRVTVTFNNVGGIGLTNLSATAPLGSGSNTYVLSASPSATTTCAGNPSVLANPNTASISMSGATLAAGASCVVSFDVTTTLGGPWVLTIPVGNISSSEGARNTTAVIANLGSTTPTAIGVNNSFSPNSITGGSPSALQIDLTNPLGSTGAVSSLGIVDALPNGMVIYVNPNASTTCAGGTVTAAPGGSSVSLSGASLPVNSTCSVFVNVSSTQPANLTNSISAGQVTTREGFTNTVSSSATLSTLQGSGVLKSFSPTAITPGQVSRLSIQLLSTLTNVTLTGVAVTDSLPAGVVIAPTPNVASSCNVTPAATAGSGTFPVSGVSLAPSTSCTVQVDVTAASAGTYVNTIPLGGLTSTQGYANQTAASATLIVMPAPTVAIAFGSNPVKAGVVSTATVTITNASAAQALSGTALNFNLPAGLSVASTPNAVTTCTGATASAVAAGSRLSLTGASIGTSGSCTVKVDVLSNTPGVYAAQIPAANLVTAQGISNAVAANASLTVLQFPTVTQNFAVSNMTPGGTSQLTITLGNPNATPITLSSNFTDTLPVVPGNMTVVGINATATTCASVSAAAGGAAIGYASGATLPANGGCTISVNVTASVLGTYTNAIPAGALATTAGSSQTLSTAALIVANGTPPTANPVTSTSVNATATSAQALSSMSGVANASGATITSYQVITLPTAGTLYCSGVAITSVAAMCAANGLSFLPSGTTPNPVTFTYTVTDSNGTASASALFSIPLAVNTPPVANGLMARFNNNVTPAVALGSLTASAQTGASIVSYAIISLPAAATLSCAGTVISVVPTNCASNGLTILPVGLPTAASTFNFTATDSNGLVSPAAAVTVNWNVPPVANSYAVTVSNAGLAQQPAGTLSATAQAGATIAGYQLTGLPATATLYCAGTAIASVPFACANNGLTIAPASLATASTSFTYTATDSNALTSAAATVTVNWSNKPTATAGLSTLIDPSITGVQSLNALSGTTPNGGATVSTYTIVTLPTSGTLYCNSVAISAVPTSCAANAVGFIAGNGFTSATFTYTVTDSTGAVSDAAVYSIGSLASPSLKIAMSVAAPLTVGFNGTYTIQVSNTSTTVPSGAPVSVTDVLPAGLDYVSASGAGWVCSWTASTRTSTCTYAGVLAANAQAPVINLVVKPNAQAVPTGTSATISDISVVAGGGELPSYANGTAPGAQPHSATVVQTVGLAAVISGSSWVDLNHNGVLDAGEPVPAANIVRVEVWPAGTTTLQTVGGTPIASALIDASGKYTLTVPASNVQIRFVDTSSNATLGLPVNGDSLATRNQPSVTGSNGIISHGVIDNITLTPGATLVEQSLPIDPQGIIYDSGTRLPLGGATITIIANGAPVPGSCLVGGVNPVVTAASGGTAGVYQFLLDFSAPGCAALSGATFKLNVSAPGYTVPSQLIKDGLNGHTVLTTPAGAGNYAVVSKSGIPVGSDPTTYYFQFVLSSASQGVINNYIPADGANVAALSVSKVASKATAEMGDTVRYTITVRNNGTGVSPQGLTTDRLPLGFKMLANTASWTLAANTTPVTPTTSGNLLLFATPSIPAGASASLVYTVRVGIGADRGDGVNHAKASFGSFESNDATATVKVSAGVFGVSACIVGKVFSDCDATGIQQEGAKGLPGVRIYLETGVSMVTDADGKYSYCGVEPRTHALKIDPSTLPSGAVTVITSNRNLGDPNSLLVDVKNGELVRGDFAVNVCAAPATSAVNPPPSNAANEEIFFSSGDASGKGAK